MTSQGQVIGAIVADNQLISQRAAKLVKIDYEELSPIIITIEVSILHYKVSQKKISCIKIIFEFNNCRTPYGKNHSMAT